MAKIYLFFIIVSLLGGVGYGGYSYYLWSQETMNTLHDIFRDSSTTVDGGGFGENNATPE